MYTTYGPTKGDATKRNMATIVADNVNILKLDSNFFTSLVHNTLGKEKPKKSWQYLTISIFLVFNFVFLAWLISNCGILKKVFNFMKRSF